VTLPLSSREREVLTLATEGRIDKTIAAELNISLGTVRVYWKRLREKLGGKTRAEILVAFGRGEIPGLAPESSVAGLTQALEREVRDALADLRRSFPDDCQTPQSLRFRLAVDALLGAPTPTAPEGA